MDAAATTQKPADTPSFVLVLSVIQRVWLASNYIAFFPSVEDKTWTFTATSMGFRVVVHFGVQSNTPEKISFRRLNPHVRNGRLTHDFKSIKEALIFLASADRDTLL